MPNNTVQLEIHWPDNRQLQAATITIDLHAKTLTIQGAHADDLRSVVLFAMNATYNIEDLRRFNSEDSQIGPEWFTESPEIVGDGYTSQRHCVTAMEYAMSVLHDKGIDTDPRWIDPWEGLPI